MNSDMSQHVERPRQINRVFLKETVKALCGLSAGERQAIVVLGIHEGSQHRMAEILKEPVGTVKSRIARARAVLRQEIIQLAGREGTALPAVELLRVK